MRIIFENQEEAIWFRTMMAPTLPNNITVTTESAPDFDTDETTKAKKPVLVNDTGLSLRAKNILRSMEIIYIDNVAEISDWDLLHAKNMGKKTLDEIRNYDHGHWLSLPYAERIKTGRRTSIRKSELPKDLIQKLDDMGETNIRHMKPLTGSLAERNLVYMMEKLTPAERRVYTDVSTRNYA